MKSKFTQRRYRAPKRSSCAMFKPQQRGWSDKKTPGDWRRAIEQEQQIREWERAFPRSPLAVRRSRITDHRALPGTPEF
jgi:hypothetical protein